MFLIDEYFADRRMHSISDEDDANHYANIPLEEVESSFWINKAQNHLKDLLASEPYNTPKKAKNIILFLGDGMSLTTVAATRVFIGGEAKSLSFEKFPYFGLSKVIHIILFVLINILLFFSFFFGKINKNYFIDHNEK